MKPSYLTSTFSLITLIIVIGLTALCIWTKDVNTLKDIAMIVLGAYGVKKGQENQTGASNENKS